MYGSGVARHGPPSQGKARIAGHSPCLLDSIPRGPVQSIDRARALQLEAIATS